MAFGPEGNDPFAGESREGLDKRRAVRLLVAGIAIVVAVLFMAQNNQRVELEFLMFSIGTRLWVGMLVTLLLGALLGQAVEALWARRKRRNAAA
jgi:uncharacterized integral membrane protein